MQVNIELLQNSQGIIPGDTLHLDSRRKRQLETVAKAMSFSPKPLDSSGKYLAERGKNILA